MLKQQRTSAIILIAAIAIIMFFTLQDADASRNMSESVRTWLNSHGIEIGYKALRNNAHIVEYLIFGLALMMLVQSRGCKNWIGMVIGCGVGFLDESVKVLLPGREFELGDVCRDWLGIVLATMAVIEVKTFVRWKGQGDGWQNGFYI